MGKVGKVRSKSIERNTRCDILKPKAFNIKEETRTRQEVLV